MAAHHRTGRAMDHQPPGGWEPIRLFVLAYLFGFAGAATRHYRRPSKLQFRYAIASFFYSGFLSLFVALVWWERGKDSPFLLLAICLLSGIGGQTVTLGFVKLLQPGIRGILEEFGKSKNKPES